ncbi:MAG: hypothetical protein ABIB04_02530 [Patescibacteria group bacterium]
MFIDLLGSVGWFPVWWYTKGLKKVSLTALNTLHYRIKSYGLRIWIKNFFKPMYGQYDLTGKLVSIFVRFMVLIGRLIALVVEGLIYSVGILVWIIFPSFVFMMAVVNLVQGAFIEQLRSIL